MIKSTYLTVEASSLFSFFFLEGELLCNAQLVFPTGSYTETASTSRSTLLALVLEATLHSLTLKMSVTAAKLHLFPRE